MPFKCLVGVNTPEGTTENRSRNTNQKKKGISCHKSHIAPDNFDSPLQPSLVKGSQWENLPSELLNDIIYRVEGRQTSWPARRDVVTCAAVCRLWRDTVKHIVQTPEKCGLLTFPMSLKQPGPRGEPIQCFIKRDRTASIYRLYLGLSPALAGDASKLLLAAKKTRKATKTQFLISLAVDDFSQSTNTYVGKLRSNFLGTKFFIYDNQPLYNPIIHSNPRFNSKKVSPGVSSSPSIKSKIATITYELNFLRTKGPRRMLCTMNTIPTISDQESPHSPVSNPKKEFNPLILKNKAPRWHEQLQCWCLNFKGRVTVASVKNFQLGITDPPENNQSIEQDDVVLQFGKIGKDIFTMDYRYPLSAFQAFAICLSSFDTKPACE